MSSPSGSGSGIQNTIEYGSLGISAAKTGYSMLTFLLSYSAASVDPYTGESGTLACSQYELCPSGQELVYNAVHGLPRFVLQDILVGFGNNHIIRKIVQSSGGCTLLALCGVLAESYHKDFAPECLYELMKLAGSTKPTSLPYPSIGQWKALLGACAGLLATTNFGKLTEEIYRKYPQYYDIATTLPITGERDPTAKISSPESVAKTLHAIASLSASGSSLDNIVVRGGQDITWLAVLAKDFFDLRIIIRSSYASVLLYTNCDGMDYQVLFLLEFENENSNAGTDPLAQLQLEKKVYILQDASKILKARRDLESFSLEPTMSAGRLQWDEVFSEMFGFEFTSLFSNGIKSASNQLSAACGTFARLLEAVALAEERVPKELIATWVHYSPNSYGPGFSQHLRKQFPELEGLDMEEYTSMALDDALTKYENTMGMIAEACNCRMCKRNLGNAKKRCKVQIVETILSIGLMLAGAHILPGLLPKRAGIEALYRMQMGTGSRTHPVRTNNAFTLFCRVWHHGGGVRTSLDRFNDYGTLFSGYSWRDDPRMTAPNLSAASRQGICVISGSLIDMVQEFPRDFEIVYVTIGAIEHDEKQFRQVRDPLNDQRSLLPAGPIKAIGNPVMKVSETADALELWFDLKVDNMGNPITVRICPIGYTRRVLSATGWIECDNSDRCQRIHDVDPREKDQTIVLHGQNIRMLEADTLTRWALISMDDTSHSLIVQNGECIQCSLRVAMDGTVASLLDHHLHKDQWLMIGRLWK